MPQLAKKLTFNAVLNQDPSRTKIIRDAFVREVNRRFAALKKAIRVAIVDMDCFGLSPVHLALSIAQAKQLVKERAFAFPRASAKVDGFMGWLNEQEEKFIMSKGAGGIQVIRRPGTISGINDRWTDTYIQSAYQRGIIRGRQELKNAGVEVTPINEVPGGVSSVFNQPFHAERVGLLYTRCFNELKGIDRAMDQQISRVLSQGLADGRGPREIARQLNDRVSKIGITRARTMARTEVVRAHHIANIEEYKRAGLEGVKVKAEWSTAGFQVCPICAPLEGQVFTLDEIQSMIPAHPNCRCTALPWRKEWDEPVEEDVRKAVEENLSEIALIPPKGNLKKLVDDFEAPGGRIGESAKRWVFKGSQEAEDAYDAITSLQADFNVGYQTLFIDHPKYKRAFFKMASPKDYLLYRGDPGVDKFRWKGDFLDLTGTARYATSKKTHAVNVYQKEGKLLIFEKKTPALRMGGSVGGEDANLVSGIFKITKETEKEIHLKWVSATKEEAKKVASTLTREKFVLAKNLDELTNKFTEMKLGYPAFDSAYADKQALDLGNRVAEHFDGVFSRHPKLVDKLSEQQKLFNMRFNKAKTLKGQGQGLLGMYSREKLEIQMAGSLQKRDLLQVGKGKYNISQDLFSVNRHEFGHHVYAFMDYEDKKPFMAMWKKNAVIDSKGHIELPHKYFKKKVSTYAATNEYEAFAESFSAYTSPKYKVGMLPSEIEEYFDDIIGRP